MKTAREKYHNDPVYHALVDHLMMMIQQCQLTPSELREAALLACIRSEDLRTTAQRIMDEKRHQRLSTMLEELEMEPEP